MYLASGPSELPSRERPSRQCFARWCSGSTSAFGAVSPGSNPGRAASPLALGSAIFFPCYPCRPSREGCTVLALVANPSEVNLRKWFRVWMSSSGNRPLNREPRFHDFGTGRQLVCRYRRLMLCALCILRRPALRRRRGCPASCPVRFSRSQTFPGWQCPVR